MLWTLSSVTQFTTTFRPSFGMPMKELLECKHLMEWIEFEKGLIGEEELARKFFIDGRGFDLEGLKECIR
ncbi:Flavin mononucleotide hydrolase 1, chloroplatic [Cardamine amara subsp. amara]|uniref:Flavin mononucleotide hydrolase 1, chloroplatic n=1 Tax=Cardamine amara subsp. amara TaxID=228776 RepID=A0ABD0ZXP8_CARAN